MLLKILIEIKVDLYKQNKLWKYIKIYKNKKLKKLYK